MTTSTTQITEGQLGAPLLSLDELMTWTGVPKSTLYSLLSAGKGPRCLKIGRVLRFRASDVESWLEELTNAREAAA